MIFTKDQYIQDVAAIVGDSMADLVNVGPETNVFSSELRQWVIVHDNSVLCYYSSQKGGKEVLFPLQSTNHLNFAPYWYHFFCVLFQG